MFIYLKIGVNPDLFRSESRAVFITASLPLGDIPQTAINKHHGGSASKLRHELLAVDGEISLKQCD